MNQQIFFENFRSAYFPIPSKCWNFGSMYVHEVGTHCTFFNELFFSYHIFVLRTYKIKPDMYSILEIQNTNVTRWQKFNRPIRFFRKHSSIWRDKMFIAITWNEKQCLLSFILYITEKWFELYTSGDRFKYMCAAAKWMNERKKTKKINEKKIMDSNEPNSVIKTKSVTKIE